MKNKNTIPKERVYIFGVSLMDGNGQTDDEEAEVKAISWRREAARGELKNAMLGSYNHLSLSYEGEKKKCRLDSAQPSHDLPASQTW